MSKLPLVVLVVGLIAIGVLAWLAMTGAVAVEPARVDKPVAAAPVAAPVVVDPAVERSASVASEPSAFSAVAEWSDSSWRELQRELRPNELEVRVLRGRTPVVGAQVRVWPIGAGWQLEPCFGVDPPHFVGKTGLHGTIRFEPVPAGAFAVRADDGDDCVCGPATVGPVVDSTRRTLVLLLGTASITGTVVDPAGAPWVGVPVNLTGIGPLPVRAQRTLTDRSGRYRFGAVHGGRYHVQIEPQAPESVDFQRMLSLRPGESARMDFGPVGPQFELNGHVVDGNGQRIPGERQLRMRETQYNDERCTITSADGSYSVLLPAGNWSIGTSGFLEPPEPIARVALTRSPTELPVPFPGIRLLVFVHAAPEIEPTECERTIWLDQGRADHVFVQDGVPVLQWLSRTPGAYRLQAQAGLRFVDAPLDGVMVTLDAQQPVVQVHANVARMR